MASERSCFSQSPARNVAAGLVPCRSNRWTLSINFVLMSLAAYSQDSSPLILREVSSIANFDSFGFAVCGSPIVSATRCTPLKDRLIRAFNAEKSLVFLSKNNGSWRRTTAPVRAFVVRLRSIRRLERFSEQLLIEHRRQNQRTAHLSDWVRLTVPLNRIYKFVYVSI